MPRNVSDGLRRIRPRNVPDQMPCNVADHLRRNKPPDVGHRPRRNMLRNVADQLRNVPEYLFTTSDDAETGYFVEVDLEFPP